MINVIISGICGKMGQLIKERIKKEQDINCVGGVDVIKQKNDEDIPVVENLNDIIKDSDIIIDFSVASATMEKIPICVNYRKGMIIGTTGFSTDELKQIEEAGAKIPVLLSFNMSIVTNLMYKLVSEASDVLKDGFDVEIIEKHHRYKKDSPSGTALNIGKIVAKKRGLEPDMAFKIGRKGFDVRKKDDITFHSIRGGTIVSDHEILFIGDNEILKISHTAFSREIFADGVIKGIHFLFGKNNGFYTMEDVLKL
jgi:4-hydroxy-tetrahydrodipicolinate reductase